MVYKLGYRVLHSSANGVKSGDNDASIKPHLMVFVHGLWSSSTTYAELAQKAINNYASATCQPWQGVLVDLPGHGASWPTDEPDSGLSHSMTGMAEDVLATLVTGHQEGKWGSVDVLVGHSTGGLVVLGMADRLGQAATGGKQEKLAALSVPKQVWVLDARAFSVTPDTPARSGYLAFTGALESVPQPYKSVDDLVKAALAFQEANGLGNAEATWLRPLLYSMMKTNPSGPGYVRQYNAAVIPEMVRSFCLSDFKPVIDHPPKGCTIHSVAGLASNLWPEDGAEELAFLQHQEESGAGVRLHKIGGDHFLTITHAKELLSLLAREAEELVVES